MRRMMPLKNICKAQIIYRGLLKVIQFIRTDMDNSGHQEAFPEFLLPNYIVLSQGRVRHSDNSAWLARRKRLQTVMG